MKKLLFYFFLVLCMKASIAQVACYDAIRLTKLLDDHKHFKNGAEQKDSLLTILSNYPGKGQFYLSDFQDSLINPFIYGYFDEGRTYTENFIPNITSSALSSLGGLDVTTIADGLAKFLVKRTKEELNVAFFSKFKETLNKPEYTDLKVLFPGTWELLDAIGNEIYDYNKYLQNLREAFLSDIKVLDENLPGIIPNHEDFFNTHFEYAVSLNSACYISTSLRKKVHPGDILDNYPLEKYFMKDGVYFNRNWSGAIQTLQLISASLRDTVNNEDKYWVSYNQVKELVNNKDAFKIYLGLIYQVAKNDRYDSVRYANNSLVGLLDRVAVKFDSTYIAYKNYILNYALKTNALNDMLKYYSKPGEDSIAFEFYAGYFKASVDLIEYSIQVISLPYFNEIIDAGPVFRDELNVYFKIVNEAAELAIAINRKNYSSAVNHTVTLYNLTRTKVLKNEVIESELEKEYQKTTAKETRAIQRYQKRLDKLAEIKQVPADTLAKILNAALDSNSAKNKAAYNKMDFKSKKDKSEQSEELLEKLARYGSFMATVASAQTSEEVEKAIESAALPAGSSRIKRETPFNVSLNAYTGLFAGSELIKGFDDKFKFNCYGLTAPIGVATSWGVHHFSLSAFVSIIDIGAVAAFRFQDDSTEQVPTIQLQDIFSPGLFFSLGLPKCPLSVNMGAQVGPNLRSVNVKDPATGEFVNEYQNNVYWRISLSVVVDIPIFNFYTKSR